IRGYELPLLAIVATSLIAFWRGASDRTGDDLGALGKLAVGLALFCACLVVIRSRDDLRLAFLALGLAGAIAPSFPALQLAAPAVRVPGMLSASGGAVQRGVYGISSNLRATGPLGDYELFAELLALIGTLGAYLGLRARGWAAAAWLVLVPAAIVG